jgi:hypothetical protein
MARKKRTAPPVTLDHAIASASSILQHEDTPAGLARAERCLAVTWPELSVADRAWAVGFALGAARTQRAILVHMPILDRVPSREGAQ